MTSGVVIGAALMGGGPARAIPANLAFRSAGTRVEPWRPSTALVTDGIFARLRNPMYVGGAPFLAGLGIALASGWVLVITVGFAIILLFGVVRRGKRELEAK